MTLKVQSFNVDSKMYNKPKKMKTLFTVVLLMVFSGLKAQIAQPPLTFSGYLETYYSYDFQNPGSHEKPAFLYNFNRHNEVNLNLGFIKANYTTDKVRGNLALMAGTYAQYNLSAEQGLLKHVFEANAGIKLAKNHNLWIDAGLMPSHIGFESAVGKDCWNLSRSLLAENSPYYETGVKIGYTSANEKWYLSGMVLNGWQRIRRPEGNNTPGFGHQLTYKPNGSITLNSSSFIGNDKPDSVRQMRYFHNFYMIAQLSQKIGATLGFDYGAEQQSFNSKKYYAWYSPVLIVKIKTSEKTAIALRTEYYADQKGVIISTGTANGFKTFGYSLNFDYAFVSNVLWRSEIRGFNSKDAIFTVNDKASNHNLSLTTSLAISF